MQILIHTDRNIESTEKLATQVEAAIEGAAKRFGPQVTRVEVHLSDVNGNKGGVNDKRCLLEARLAGLPSLTVSHQAPTLELAVDGASVKLGHALESTRGRLSSGRHVIPEQHG